mmetsp:Transcript_32275/g.55228  ORF Transcript_32275/g.55228 Transcript_32275/m.55228 type:complete len:249 (-) Transcript_32275:9-755(-)
MEQLAVIAPGRYWEQAELAEKRQPKPPKRMRDESPPPSRASQRAYVRPEGNEEITPPVPSAGSSKQLSIDSLCVARMLQEKLGHPDDFERDLSPSLQVAAMALQKVQAQASTDSAAGCLMSLAGASSEASPMRRSAVVATRLGAPQFRRSGSILTPGQRLGIKMHSSLTSVQLQMLAAAYKICPHPSEEQLSIVSERVDIDEAELRSWFHSRRVLEVWLLEEQRHGCMTTAEELKEMFYQESEGDEWG